MSIKRWAAAAALALLVAGCDEANKPGKVTIPATRPADVTSVAKEAATEQPKCNLAIGLTGVEPDKQDKVSFPRARLRVHQKDAAQGTIVLMLFSDNPKPAFNEPNLGNSFYFEMELRAGSLAELDSQSWQFNAGSMERRETVTGIFLDGATKQLQPFNVNVGLTHDKANPKKWTLALNGVFQQFHVRDKGTVPQMFNVNGMMEVELEE